MKINVVLIASVLFLAGCSHCQVATFYKPFTSGDNRFRTDSGSPTYVGITLGDVPFTISVCGDRPLTPPGDTAALCIALELDAADSLQFSEPTVTIGTDASHHKAVAMTTVEYEISCRVEKGKRICSSTEESPIAGPVRQVPATGGADRFAFDPTFEFRGAKDTLHEGAMFGHRSKGKRKYYIRTITIPVQRGAELSVLLPEVILNGRVLKVPMVKFRAVTDEVCRLIPLA